MQFGIGTLDLIVIVVYLAGIVGLGCWVGLKHRRQGGGARITFLLEARSPGRLLDWLSDGWQSAAEPAAPP